MSSLQSQAGKDKEAMEEDYQKALELIFPYGYGCCAFKHNICKDQPEVSDGMPESFALITLEFLVNPRCLSAPIATKVIAVEAEPGKTIEKAKDPERSTPVKDFAGTS